MPAREDLTKKDQRDQQYAEALESERIYYEQGAGILARRASLTLREKAQYRLLAGKIADIYTYKKNQAKGNPAEMAKYEAAEKMWDERSQAIK